MPANIPKIIWQTHNYEFDDLPEHFKMTAKAWQNVNPGWEYRYVNHIEREETVKKYPEFWKYYHTQQPICQADMWRYIVTYEHGGVYADMDSVCTMPLDYLLDNSDEHELFVVPSFIWWDYLEYRIKRLKSKGFTNAEIKERLDFQAKRSGIQAYQLEALYMIQGHSTNNANFAVKKHSKVMKQIILHSQNHLAETVLEEKTQTNLLGPFLDVVQGSKDNTVLPAESVSFTFDVAYHDDPYKDRFEPNFSINDYGTYITYENYLKKYNLSIC